MRLSYCNPRTDPFCSLTPFCSFCFPFCFLRPRATNLLTIGVGFVTNFYVFAKIVAAQPGPSQMVGMVTELWHRRISSGKWVVLQSQERLIARRAEKAAIRRNNQRASE
jgi:hypothetical protein